MEPNKIVMLTGGEWHDFETNSDLITRFIERSGRYSVTIIRDPQELTTGILNDAEALIAYNQGGKLTDEAFTQIAEFVKSGKGFVGLHAASAAFKDHTDYHQLLGSKFLDQGPQIDFRITFRDADHPIIRRIAPFTIFDELFVLEPCSDYEPLAYAYWRGKFHPCIYIKNCGNGRIFYNSLGHGIETIHHTDFQRLLLRGLDWVCGREERGKVRCGLIGFGASYGMGTYHGNLIRGTEGLEFHSVCEINPDRLDAAKTEFPFIKPYSKVDQFLADPMLDLAVIVTPHDSHSKLAIQCMEAEKHTIVEKPMCITKDEVYRMIDTAKKQDCLLSVFHNRRWDVDFLTIKNIIQKGMLGQVFQVEYCASYYGAQSHEWRSEKHISGGIMYDWGAHVLDWVLLLIPQQIRGISGFFQKLRWHDVSNEDHGQIILRFDKDIVAMIEISSLAAVQKPRWRILGDKGGLLLSQDPAVSHVEITSYASGLRYEGIIPFMEQVECGYYNNLADHLLLDEPLEVTPEQAGKVVAVLDSASTASKEQVAQEFNFDY